MWWQFVREPAGQLHLWPLGDLEGNAQEAVVDQIKAFHGVPVDWIEDVIAGRPAWDVALAPGEPHRDRLAEAQLHTLDELTRTVQP